MNRTWKTSWQIFRCSLQVMQHDKALLLFPALTFACTIGLFLFFAAPVVLQPTGYSLTQAQHWTAVKASVFYVDPPVVAPGSGRAKTQAHLTNLATAYGVVLYFASLFFAIFFNAAFCSQIFSALAGGPVSVQAGLKFALARWKEILIWSLFAGLVGLVIRKLEERFGLVGRFVIGLIGLAWSVASVFAIPVIVQEPVTANPLDILRQSAGTIKKTWGESLVGYIGMNMGGGLVLLGSFLILAVGGGLSYLTSSVWPFAISGILWFASLVLFGYLSSVAGLIYQCGLYLYASTGMIPAVYTADQMAFAWKRK